MPFDPSTGMWIEADPTQALEEELRRMGGRPALGMPPAPAMPPREGMVAGDGAPAPGEPYAGSNIYGGTPGGGTPADNAAAAYLFGPAPAQPQTVFDPDKIPPPADMYTAEKPADPAARYTAENLTPGQQLAMNTPTKMVEPNGGILQPPKPQQPTPGPPIWSEWVGGRPHRFEMTGRTMQSQQGIEVPEEVWRLGDHAYLSAREAADYGADAAYKKAKVDRAWEIGKAEAEEDAATLKAIQQREYETELESRRNYYENLEVDSRRVWNNMGTFQKAIAVIGMALGGGIQAVTGQNPYMNVFNKIVNDDINDQKANREAIKQGIGILGEQQVQTMASLEEERIKRLTALAQQVHKMATEMGVDDAEVSTAYEQLMSGIYTGRQEEILKLSMLEADKTAISKTEGWRGGMAPRRMTMTTDLEGAARSIVENLYKNPNVPKDKVLEMAQKQMEGLGFSTPVATMALVRVQEGLAGKPSMAYSDTYLSEEKMKEGGYEFVPTGPASADGKSEPGVKVTATNAVALKEAQKANTAVGSAIKSLRRLISEGHGTRETPLGADWGKVRAQMALIRAQLRDVYKLDKDELNAMLGRPESITNIQGIEMLAETLEGISSDLTNRVQDQYGRPAIRTFIEDPITGERKSVYYEQGTATTRPFLEGTMRPGEMGTGGHTRKKGPKRPGTGPESKAPPSTPEVAPYSSGGVTDVSPWMLGLSPNVKW